MAEDYKIDRVRRSCRLCSKEFRARDPLISAVVKAREEGLERIDFCRECWPRNTEEVFSYWEGIFPSREKPKLADMEKVQKFFVRLLPRPEPDLEGVKFFTALVLWRKKRVRLEGTRTEGGREILRFEKTWDGEPVELADPGFTDEMLAQIRARMEQLFEMELEPHEGSAGLSSDTTPQGDLPPQQR